MTAPLEIPDDPRELVGRVLFGRFRVVEQLARGAMASVYRAEDDAGAKVALKIFDPVRRADPVASARFRREFDILRDIEHPGVAAVRELAASREMDALVLEWVEGEPLSARLARGPLAIDEARAIFAALAETVACFHRRGVVHRDLKPENVMLSATRGPVILDFGVAHVSTAMTLTRTGAVIGTPRYLAPEALASSDTDARVDVFSLGVMLLEATTGRSLRVARTIGELVGELASPPPPIAQLAPSLPPDLARIIARAIAHAPEARFATATELAAALRGQVSAPLLRVTASAADIRCESCRSPEIVDLPFCPGCGVAVGWALEPGPFTAQIIEAPFPNAVARELARSSGRIGRRSVASLTRRIARPPVVLVRDVSERSARAVAQGVEEHGARVEIMRSRSFLGPPLRSPALTAARILALAAAHFVLTIALGALAVFFGAPAPVVFIAPVVAAALGYLALRRRASRPLLRPAKDERRGASIASTVQEKLRALKCDRARRLAFTAVSRAAPLLLGRVTATPKTREACLDALSVALDHAGELDRHRAVLDRRSKATLIAELDASRSDGDVERVAELTTELSSLAEVALAYDLAAQLSLEATAKISDALAADD